MSGGLAFIPGAAPVCGAEFRRGDSDGNGFINISDAIRIFGWLFLGGVQVSCIDATDVNDSGDVDIADGIFDLFYIFLGGPEPPSPGPRICGPDPTEDGLSCQAYTAACGGQAFEIRRIGHVLNRIAYGPTPAAMDRLQQTGIEAYIQEQLHPETIDESDNTALLSREDALFRLLIPAKDSALVAVGEPWHYFKGTVEPPAAWKDLVFDDASWRTGPTGIGYGDGDDAEILTDMMNSYLSVYLRRKFTVQDVANVDNLLLRIDYDDGFVAYLNGSEVARRGVSGNPPPYDAMAVNHEAGTPEEIDIGQHKNLLHSGENVLAIQVHNTLIGSGDLSMIPALISRTPLPWPSRKVIRGLQELQQLPHIRGIYSRRQLQAVLAEFWDNHFTTDVDKVADYLNKLQASDGTDAMGDQEARAEAAQLETLENRFFLENGLGNFGDLLLFSATSPTMLIYLDSVLNVKGAANENYSREILELFAFGVDNRYTQTDIQELAKCFTGWSLCKVAGNLVPTFPQSALAPPQVCGVSYDDTVLIDAGAGWRYFKGSAEPSPAPGDGSPTTGWAALGFDDSAWTAGSTGIGYGDGDDATILSDMQNHYMSVYLRRTFTVADPAAVANLVLEASYDDGFVAYLNGNEVARTKGMAGTGTPPARDVPCMDSHEVTLGAETFSLNGSRGLLMPGVNVLAIQVHNASLNSGDLSMIPRLLDRAVRPDSVENGDPNGIWTFHFDPDRHDTTAKTLFKGTPNEIKVPAGRTGMAGLSDAIDVVQALARHPSAAEFISIKLIQKFVSDEISLAALRSATVPEDLKALLADAIGAWNSTSPPGNIRTVLEAILDPAGRTGPFWSDRSYRAKVKNPIEFINSTIRAFEGSATGKDLPGRINAMGMDLFTRDDPDGWPEIGVRWIDTATLLARINFGQTFAENHDSEFVWTSGAYLSQRGLDSAEKIVDFFDGLLFQGTLPAGRREALIGFLTTDVAGQPLALSPAQADFDVRVEEFVGLLLSLPEWTYQ